MKVEAAIFDIGNVLVLFDYMKAANRLVLKNGLRALPDRAAITAANHEFELGHTTRTQFLAAVRHEFQDTGREEEFVAIWEDIFEENVRMTSFARELSLRMPVFLISNIGEIHHRHLFSRFDEFSLFRQAMQVRIAKMRRGFIARQPLEFNALRIANLSPIA